VEAARGGLGHRAFGRAGRCRGARFDLAARVCRLPDDAAKAMFKTQ